MLWTGGRRSRKQLARQKLIALQMMTLSGVVRPADVELRHSARPSRLFTPSSESVNPSTLKLSTVPEQDRSRLIRQPAAVVPEKVRFRTNRLFQLHRILSGFQWGTERT